MTPFQMALVAAAAIRSELTGAPRAKPQYAAACWSTIDTDDAVKVGGRYEPKDGRIAAVERFVSRANESPQLRSQNQRENMDWYAAFTADIFS